MGCTCKNAGKCGFCLGQTQSEPDLLGLILQMVREHYGTTGERFLRGALASAQAEGAREALEQAQRAVVEACEACEGQGWTIGITTGYGHACDGTDASCSQNCPVPVPEQIQEPCEYCGRPSAAIVALSQRLRKDGPHE
jgi:hypothetical protein